MRLPPSSALGPSPRPTPRGRFVALLVTQVCFGMSFSTFFLLPKYMAQELRASEVTIGVISAAGALTGVASFPVVGALNDRYGRLRFVLLGNGLMTASALMVLTFTSAGLGLLIMRMLHGLSFALSFNSTTTLATDRVDRQDFGRVLALFGTALLSTNALAPAVAETVAATAGWQATFQLAGAFGAASVLSALFVSDTPRSAAGHGAPARGVLSMLRQSHTAVVTIAVAAAGAGFGTAFTFYQPFALGMGIERVSDFFIAYAVLALGVRLIAVTRLERMGRQNLSAASLLLYAAAVAAAGCLRPGLLAPVGALMGLAHGVFYPVCNALAIEHAPLPERGSRMALYHGSFNAGFALSVLCGGVIIARWGYPALFFGTAALVAAVAVSLWQADLTPHDDLERRGVP